MASLADINVRIGASIQNLERNLAKAERKLRRSGANMARIGSELTQVVSIPILGIGAAAIKTAGDFEQLENGLKSIMGDAEAAKKEITLLRKEALKPGLNLKQAIQGSVRLQSVGIDAELARNALANFGNAIALAGGRSTDLDGVTLALTQIISKGKISAEEINQLAERVPQVRKAIQDAFGTADSEQLQKLGISAEEFVNKVTFEMGKLPTATSGIANALENAGQGIQVFLAELGMEINKAFDITGLANKFTEKLAAISNAFKNLDDRTKKTILKIAAFAAAIGPAFIVLGKLKMALGAVLGAIKAVFSLSTLKSLLNPWTLAIGAIVGAGILIVKNWDQVKKVIVNVANSVIVAYNNSLKFRALVQSLSFVFKTVWNTIKTVFKNIKLGITGLGDAIGKVLRGDFDGAKQSLTDWFKEDASNWSALGTQIGNDFSSALENTVKGRMDLVDESIFSGLEKTAKNVVSAVDITGGGGSAPGTFSGGGKKEGTRSIDGIMNTFQQQNQQASIISEALGDPTLIMETATAVDHLTMAMQDYEGVQLSITSTAKQMSNALGEFFHGLGEVAGSVAKSMTNLALAGETSFKKLGQAALDSAKQVVRANILKGVTSVISGTLSSLGFTGPIAVAVAGAAGAAATVLFNKAISAIGIPAFADGVRNFSGGMALVGERGPELVNLPRGSNVIPNHAIGRMGSGNVHIADVQIRGSDLWLIFDKYQKVINRTT